jgi:hypothetical protein
MGLDLLPILPRALPSGSAVAVVGQRARPQLHGVTEVDRTELGRTSHLQQSGHS